MSKPKKAKDKKSGRLVLYLTPDEQKAFEVALENYRAKNPLHVSSGSAVLRNLVLEFIAANQSVQNGGKS